MARPSQSVRRSAPVHIEGRFARWWRELRWSWGFIRADELARRTDAELIGIAEDFVRRRKPKQAAQVLGAFGQRTTVDPRVLQRYGDISRAIGAHEGAIMSYLQASEMYVQQGVYQKASALLSQLVRTYPENLDARVALARVFEALDRKKEAAANYAAIVQILEAAGQGAATGPFVARIAALWPMARADFASAAAMPPPAVPPGVFSEPPGLLDAPGPPTLLDAGPPVQAPMIVSGKKLEDLTGPLELDLASYVGMTPVSVEQPTSELAPDAIDALVAHPDALRSDSDIVSARPPMAESNYGGDFPTASYEAIDGAKTLMDLQAVTVPADGKSIVIDLRDVDRGRQRSSTNLRVDPADTSPEDDLLSKRR
ncbi:MAG: hypothetical protein U1E65_14905 [Myxococcota bacterium]